MTTSSFITRQLTSYQKCHNPGSFKVSCNLLNEQKDNDDLIVGVVSWGWKRYLGQFG